MIARDIETVQAAGPGLSAAFKPLTVLLLFIVGLVSFGAFISLSGFKGDLQKKDYAARPHALSKSPNGFAGIVHLLRSENHEVDMSRNDADLAHEDTHLLVVTIPSPHNNESVAAIDAGGPTLFILPKWQVVADRKVKNGARKLGLYKAASINDVLTDLAPPLTVSQSSGKNNTDFEFEDIARTWFTQPDSALTVDSLQTLDAPDMEAIIRAPQSAGGGIVLGFIPDSSVYILSDPDLLNNSGIKTYDGAVFAVDLMEYLTSPDGSPVYFDLTVHGLNKNQNLIKTMLTPPFLAATLCLFAVGLMLAWRAFTRFGRAGKSLRVYALGKQVLADNSADMIRLAGREPNMAPGYAALTRKLTARDVRVPKTLSDADVTASLDRMASRANLDNSLSEMTSDAHTITGLAQLMALAKKLHKWRQEMTHARNPD